MTFNVFAEEPVFILRQNSILKDENLDKKSFKQGEKFTFKYNKKGLGVDINEPLTVSIPLYNFSDNQRYKIPINDVYLADYDFKIGENISKDYWIPSYYYDLLKSNTPLDDVLKYEKYWANFTFVAEDEPKWYDFFGIQRYYFGDFYIVVFGSDGYKDVDFFAYLEEASDNKIIYNVQRLYSHFFDYKEEVSYNQPEFLPLFEKETPFKIILTIDGDYIKMYIDEISEGNLFQTLVRTTPESCNQIENWIKGISNDLSNVTWPRHADGTCDYEAEIKQPKVQLTDYDFVSEEEESATPSAPLSENEEDVKTVEEDLPVVKQTSSLPLVIIVASAVIVLLCIVIILIVRKKKRQ